MVKRISLLALLLIASLCAQITLKSQADVTGTGAAQALVGPANARWVQMVAPSANASVVRWGDSLITTSRGAIIAAGAGQMLPAFAPATGGSSQSTLYDLTRIYVLVQIGDKITVTWGF